MRILFCGGGTLGPVTPLLAVVRRMRGQRSDVAISWVGTPSGPEAPVIESEHIPYHSIPVVKFPRYPTLKWLTLLRDYKHARRMAGEILSHERPDLVVGAGGFTEVPVMKEAQRHGIKTAIHQLDAEPGLSNRRVARGCACVTSSFAYDRSPFEGVSASRIATPCRFNDDHVTDRRDAAKRLDLDPERKTVFVFGGGTGALALNHALERIKGDLLQYAQIIHLTGKGKAVNEPASGYMTHEDFDERQMRDAYAVAEVVISRAGIGTVSELAALSKAAVVIPIPGSHQEANAERVKEGVVMLDQTSSSFEANLRDQVIGLLDDRERQEKLGQSLHDLFPTDNGSALAERWMGIIE